MSAVVELNDEGWFPDVDGAWLFGIPNQLDELDLLAESIVARRADRIEQIIADGRVQLQKRMTAALDRLVGALVNDVMLAGSPRAKLGVVLSHGKKLLHARPTREQVEACSDPLELTARCRAAADGLVVFIAGELNRALVAAGEEPIEHAELVVQECARKVYAAVVATEADGVDRTAELAVEIGRALNLPWDRM